MTNRTIHVIVLGLAALAAAAAQAVTVERPAQADAYTQQFAANADSNFGANTGTLNSRWVDGSSLGRTTYMRFDLSDLPLPEITDATVTLTFGAYSGSVNAEATRFDFYGLALDHPGNAWVEGNGGTEQGPVTPPAEITWNNAPANDHASSGSALIWDQTFGNGVLLGSFDAPQQGLVAGDQLSFSGEAGSALIDFLAAAAASDHQTATFIMLAATSSSLQIRFRSRTASGGAEAPLLEMTLTGDAPLLPGDANRDGRVDGEDFLIWQAAFGTQEGATWDDGDFNGDGRVDGEDFLIWQAHFGSVASSSAVTPEPATLGLLALGGVGLLRRARRR